MDIVRIDCLAFFVYCVVIFLSKVDEKNISNSSVYSNGAIIKIYTKKNILFLICFILLFSCNKDDEIIIEDTAIVKDAVTVIPEVRAKLPVLSINTQDLTPIVSKDDYINGTLKISSDNENENLEVNLRIRGRGNSTWTFPKKPYQIKLDDKEEVLGMPRDKKWILLANYSDKTMLRNELAFNLSRFSNIGWTPESRFVEVYINDEYLGVYQVTQKVEESSNK